jgi:phospholipid/cholesterol/gamma-HCH transport system substrate-binding protein
MVARRRDVRRSGALTGRMAQRNGAELVAGAVVLAVAAGFLWYALASTGRSVGGSGYDLHAKFDRIDGLSVGSDVRVAGVKVGSVTAARIDPKSYQAVVNFTVASDLQLPKDSSAVVTSDGLLGGKYLSLEPGGDIAMLPAGGEITLTQSSISIEQLLGKFIFSAGNLSSQKPADSGSRPAPPK